MWNTLFCRRFTLFHFSCTVDFSLFGVKINYFCVCERVKYSILALFLYFLVFQVFSYFLFFPFYFVCFVVVVVVVAVIIIFFIFSILLTPHPTPRSPHPDLAFSEHPAGYRLQPAVYTLRKKKFT